MSTANTHTFFSARGDLISASAKAQAINEKNEFALLFVVSSLLSIPATSSVIVSNIISNSDLLIILSILISGILILNLIIS